MWVCLFEKEEIVSLKTSRKDAVWLKDKYLFMNRYINKCEWRELVPRESWLFFLFFLNHRPIIEVVKLPFFLSSFLRGANYPLSSTDEINNQWERDTKTTSPKKKELTHTKLLLLFLSFPVCVCVCLSCGDTTGPVLRCASPKLCRVSWKQVIKRSSHSCCSALAIVMNWDTRCHVSKLYRTF